MHVPSQAGRTALALLCAASFFAPPPVAAQAPTEYERRELSIPMRDGTKHFAVALLPKGNTTPLPILLIRTPFSAAREFRSNTLPVALRELGEDGYLFVVEDIRGRFGSGGAFVSVRPQRDARDARGVDESTDAWDSIDWLVRELPNNSGRVGVLGVSYRGWLAALAGVDPHPALKAISPQGLMADTWMGDDFFHQGAFRQTQGVAYAAYIEGSGDLTLGAYDQYEAYLKYPTLGQLARSTGIDTIPSWVGFREHPTFDAYWKARALQRTVLARSGCLWLSLELPNARAGGVSASAGRVGRGSFGFGLLFAAIIAFIAAAPFTSLVALVLAFLVAGLIAWAWTAVCRRLIGGQTGDLIGALQALIEVGVLTVLLAFA